METYTFNARIAERWGGKQPQIQIVPENNEEYVAWRRRVGLEGNLLWKGPDLLVTVSAAAFVAGCEGVDRVRYTVRRAGRQMRGVNLERLG